MEIGLDDWAPFFPIFLVYIYIWTDSDPSQKIERILRVMISGQIANFFENFSHIKFHYNQPHSKYQMYISHLTMNRWTLPGNDIAAEQCLTEAITKNGMDDTDMYLFYSSLLIKQSKERNFKSIFNNLKNNFKRINFHKTFFLKFILVFSLVIY